MRKITLVYLVFFVTIISIRSAYAQQINWFSPWENKISNINSLPSQDIIPILNNGKNYRVLEIKDVSNISIKSIEAFSNKANVSIYYLPVVKDYRKNNILDVILPLDALYKEKRSAKFYLLFVLEGKNQGTGTVNVSVKTEQKEIKLSTPVIVSKPLNIETINLNVWAYFDSDFITKGVKQQVITDLIEHGNDFLVIPPKAIPKILGTLTSSDVDKFKEYLKGTENKFKYYSLFLGYTSDVKIKDVQWKKAFVEWTKKMNQLFMEMGVPEERVLLYLFDEPNEKLMSSLKEFRTWCKSEGIENPFYVTVGGAERKKALQYTKDIEFVHVARDLVNQLESIRKNNKSKYLTYWAVGSSRNIALNRYRFLGFEAYSNDLEGVGVWQYSDMTRAFKSKRQSMSANSNTWTMNVDIPGRDYSLVYRSGSNIRSSLRWEALSFGKEEYKYLELIEEIYGIDNARSLSGKVLTGEISIKDWEQYKVGVLKRLQ
ncbi:MAG: hypothetical protein ACTJFN_05675 [Sphingobacterium sp.]